MDFRIEPLPEYPSDAVRTFKGLLPDYPVIEEQREFEASLRLSETGEPVSSGTIKGLQGHRLRSPDRINIAQFRKDGFTHNRLSPYTDWKSVSGEALRLWDIYREVVNPVRLTRLALRYINHLTIPPRGALPDYLVVGPPKIPGAPEILTNFLLQVSSASPKGYQANVSLTLERGDDPTRSAVLLDIDVYTTQGLGLAQPQLIPVLEHLHQLKNDIFFGCITETTARNYE